MRVIDCPVCGSKVNALVRHCPECGADPRLAREEGEADLRERGIPLPQAEPHPSGSTAGTASGRVSNAASGPAVGATPCRAGAATGRPTALRRLLSPAPSVTAGPAAWPATIGAALFMLWGLEALPPALAPALLLLYPLFVRTAEHRRCRELAVDVDGGLQLLLGVAAGVMWVVLPAALSESLFGATLVFYRQLPEGALLDLVLVAGVFVPLLFGLVFRYLELRAGSWWALAVVTATYVAAGGLAAQEVTLFGVVWTALAGLVYALAYLSTRRLWLPVGLRAGTALLVTDAPVFSLDLLKVARPDLVGPDPSLHLALLGVAALVMLAVAVRRGAFVARRRAWHVQTGRPLASQGWAASPWPQVGLWAALGCAALLDGIYWYTGGDGYLLAPAVPLTYWAYVHFVERRSCYELGGGLPRAAAALVAGAAAGFALSVLSWLPDVGPFADGGFVAPDALTAELVVATLLWALCEEVIWRGLLLRSLETRLGSGLALVVSAIAFALWHWRLDYYATLDLAVAGALFGALFLLTRRVWLSTGVHTGWNLALWAWTEPATWWSATYELILMLEGAAILAALLLARRRGRLVRRPRLGDLAAGPLPPASRGRHRGTKVIDCRTCGAEVNVRVAYCPECGADPRLPREEAEADLRARGMAPPPVTRPPVAPPTAAPEGQTS
jgi:membrane protease YdiL (CAAX protease family)